MQPPNWNDLRYLLAVKRVQTLHVAARQLRVDDTTVSRRLASLERGLGKKLVQRLGNSRLVLTELGERVARDAEAMEHHYASIATLVDSSGDPCAGTVRLTSVPILANHLFARNFRDLAVRYPNLVVELIPDSRDFNLTRREADIAVRLARPTAGGMSVKARRIGTLTYAAYASRHMTRRRMQSLPWITYEDSMSTLPHARWMERAGDGAERSSLRIHDAETALEGVVAGLGKTLLPTLVADRDKRLRRIDAPADRRFPAREIWLLAHADQVELARVAVVIQWIEAIVTTE